MRPRGSQLRQPARVGALARGLRANGDGDGRGRACRSASDMDIAALPAAADWPNLKRLCVPHAPMCVCACRLVCVRLGACACVCVCVCVYLCVYTCGRLHGTRTFVRLHMYSRTPLVVCVCVCLCAVNMFVCMVAYVPEL